MAKWYQVRVYSTTIDEVEVARESAESIFLAATRPGGKERRIAKVSSYGRYFPTRAEAVEFLTNRITTRIATIEGELTNLKATLAKHGVHPK